MCLFQNIFTLKVLQTAMKELAFLKHRSKKTKAISSPIMCRTIVCLCFLRFVFCLHTISSVQSLSHVWLCNPRDYNMPGFPVHHQLPELSQTHVHQVSDVIQPSHPLSSPFPPALNLSQHQGLFQWVNSSHEVAKVLEFQLQHKSFQWAPRTDLL